MSGFALSVEAPRKPSAIRRAAIASHAAMAPRLGAVESLSEICDQVVGILTAYGDPDQARRDARHCELLLCELPMARRGRVGDDGIDPAETGGARAELEVVHEGLAGCLPPCGLEGKHAAEAVELPCRELVLGITLQSRIEDGLDRGLLLEEVRQREGVLARALETKRERLQASAEEVGGKRIEDRARVDQVGACSPDRFRATGNDPGSHVVMPVQVLRCRLADEVGALLQGSAEARRREGVVDDENAVAFGLRDRRDVGDGHSRVGHRLDVPHSCRALPRRVVVDVEMDDVDSQPAQALLRKGIRGAVELVRAEKRVAGREVREEGGSDRGHPGGHRQRRLRPFEVGEDTVQLLDGRVAQAGVEEAVLLLAHDPPELSGIFEGESRGSHDRLHEWPSRSVRLSLAVNRPGRKSTLPHRNPRRSGTVASGTGSKARPAALAPSRSVSPSPTWTARPGSTRRRERASRKSAGSGFGAPASAEVRTTSKRWSSPTFASCSRRPMSQSDTHASESPAARRRSSAATAPSSGRKTMASTKAGENSAGSRSAPADSRNTRAHSRRRAARLVESVAESLCSR